MGKTLREEFGTSEIKDNYYEEESLSFWTDDEYEGQRQDYKYSVMRPEFLSLLEEKLDNFQYWLEKITADSGHCEELDSISVTDLWVSKLYIDDTDEVNDSAEKLLLDKYKLKFMHRNKIITDFSILQSYVDFPRLSRVYENTSWFKIMLTKYDNCYNQSFPMFYILDTYKTNKDSIVLEYVSKNVKAIVDDTRLRFLVVDIDSDTRQNLVFTMESTKAHNIKIVDSDYVQMYLDNPSKAMKVEPRVVFESEEELYSYRASQVGPSAPKRYSVVREDTGEIVPNCIDFYEDIFEYKDYSSDILSRWSELFVKEYIHRFGTIMLDDITQKQDKNSDFNKYGWFATNNITEWDGSSFEKTIAYNINFYRYIIYKLTKCEVKLNDTEWKLVDKNCITFEHDNYLIRGSIFARLDKGHRVIAIGFQYENKHNFELSIKQFSSDNITFLNKYINTKFEISAKLFSENQLQVLNDCKDNNMIRLYNTEQELKDNLTIVDDTFNGKPIIRVSFYSQLCNKYVSLDISLNESMYSILRKVYPFFKFSYPLCISEIGLALDADSEKKANKLILTIQYEFFEDSSALMLNNLAIIFGHEGVQQITIPDELSNECNIHVIISDNNSGNGVRAIDIVEKNSVLKLLGTKDTEVTTKKLGYKICKYDCETDVILTRNIRNRTDKDFGITRVFTSSPFNVESKNIADNTVLQLMAGKSKQYNVNAYHYEELDPEGIGIV